MEKHKTYQRYHPPSVIFHIIFPLVTHTSTDPPLEKSQTTYNEEMDM